MAETRTADDLRARLAEALYLAENRPAEIARHGLVPVLAPTWAAAAEPRKEWYRKQADALLPVVTAAIDQARADELDAAADALTHERASSVFVMHLRTRAAVIRVTGEHDD